jgi:hypothetical protein
MNNRLIAIIAIVVLLAFAAGFALRPVVLVDGHADVPWYYDVWEVGMTRYYDPEYDWICYVFIWTEKVLAMECDKAEE